MTDVGRRPTLHELLLALHAIESIEADVAALDPKSETFRVILVFQRAQCPNDWIDGQPKPSWMFEQLIEELSAWLQQRNREEQWVSKEERMGSSIDGLMAHYTEELKRVVSARPETIATRMEKRVLQDTILRLKELKERREAGGVYSQTESNREKARKQWAEDEYEAPKRERAQNQQRARDNPNPFGDFFSEHIKRAFEEDVRRAFYGTDWGQQQKAPPRNNPSKQAWHVTLGVPASASKSDIKKAYRKLAAKFHPDRYKEPDGHTKMAEINTARDEGLGGL